MQVHSNAVFKDNNSITTDHSATIHMLKVNCFLSKQQYYYNVCKLKNVLQESEDALWWPNMRLSDKAQLYTAQCKVCNANLNIDLFKSEIWHSSYSCHKKTSLWLWLVTFYLPYCSQVRNPYGTNEWMGNTHNSSVKMLDMKLTNQVTRHEIGRHEIVRPSVRAWNWWTWKFRTWNSKTWKWWI